MFDIHYFCVAEYIPPEKQKRGMFSKNPITPNNIPLVIRREKEVAKKNETADYIAEHRQTKKLLSQLQNKLDKLKKLGIDHELKPIGDLPHIKQVEIKSDAASDTDNSYYYETVDSDIDVKVAKEPQSNGKNKSNKKK